MSTEIAATRISLLREVENLGRTIADTRSEIAAMTTQDFGDGSLPSANDELDAVMAHTAASTNTILEACEQLDQLAQNAPPELANQLQAATTVIYEACSFQDITGQRIKKVIAALQLVDSKVAGILKLDHGTPPPAELLLSGPQLPGAAMAQDSVDQLLASLA